MIPLAASLTAALALAGSVTAQSAPVLDAAQRAAVIDGVATAITDFYVYPDVGADVVAELRARVDEGRYEQSDAVAFGAALTGDLRKRDRHFSVRWTGHDAGGPRVEGGGGDGGRRVVVVGGSEGAEEDVHPSGFPAGMVESARRKNFGFPHAEILPGNIGYLDVVSFMPPQLSHDAATAGMNFIAGTDAVIIDLRNNGGGDPAAVQYLCSWFFGDEPVHLNSIYSRPNDHTEEFWTLPELPGERRPDVPLYVLTSGRTGSGAEEFAYNMSTQQRGTLVGETTGGAANPGGVLPIAHGFEVFVSTGAAINPITGTNWEAVGVRPHIEVRADTALDRAHMLAIEGLHAAADANARAALEWTLEGLEAKVAPLSLDAERLAKYAGSYGPRTLLFKNGELLYSRQGRPAQRLVAVSEDRFLIEGIDAFRLVIETDASGKGVALVGHYDNGMSDRNERDR